MKYFLFSSCLFLTMAGLSTHAESVEISEANFPNETFRTDVANQFDSDQDGWLSDEEIANVTEINYGLGAPASVEGIRFFTSLETLLLNNSPALTTLDIHGMTSLEILVLGGLPSLESINAAGCTALEDVRAQYGLGSLCNVDFSDCPSLTSLKLRETGFTSFDASDYENLTLLDVGGSYTGGQLTSIKVSNNLKLETLICTSNQLSTLNLSANKELTSLSCSYNQLTTLNLSANTKLTSLSCNNNQLGSLIISDNKELKSIGCNQNLLTTLDASSSTKLEDLQCQDNFLTTLVMPSDNDLYRFICYNNRLNKTAMDNVISCLPTNSTTSDFEVVDETSGKEENICTPLHVAAAKAKGWIAKCRRDGSWTNYEGLMQTGEVLLDENATTAPESSEGAVDVIVLRTIKANEWSTICLPFSMSETQVKEAFGDDVELADFNGYEVIRDKGDVVGLNVKFNDVTAVEANHPYIIKVSSPLVGFTVDGVVINPTENLTVATVNRTDEQWSEMTGTYETKILAFMTLFLSENKFWYSSGIFNIKPYRAYFDFYDVLSSPMNNSRIAITFGEETTSISEEWKVKSEKSAFFDLQGRRVLKPTRGLYVKEGKKVLVK